MVKNKIGILNFHYSTNNYGAVLQAAALAKYLENSGNDVKHIDYIPEVEYSSLSIKLKAFIKSFIVKEKIVNGVYGTRVFDEFRNSYIKRTKKISKRNNLSTVKNDFDVVVVGSDQVWRSEYTKSDTLTYFLDFIDNTRTKKIAYAASFGINVWQPFENNKKLTDLVRNKLILFDRVSVRESDGINICKANFGVDAKHLIDPTLLIGVEFFEEMCVQVPESNYIAYYKLDANEDFFNFLQREAQNRKLEPINIYTKNINSKELFREVGEWVSLIRYSSLVVSDSFHCICLAILFKKEFIYYPNENNRGMSRINSLFSTFGIENRIYDAHAENNSYSALDYDCINEVLVKEREKANIFFEGIV